MAGNNYSIKKNRIKKGLLQGFALEGETRLVSTELLGERYIYLKAIDGVREGASWGRLWFDLALDDEMVCYVYAVAMDQDSFYRREIVTRIEDFLTDFTEDNQVKKEFFDRTEASYFVNNNDILLYDLKGRYLYLAIEVIGEGKCTIDNIRVDSLGDNFLSAFPEVYRIQGSFFHRFLSVFSSIYNDFGEDIDDLATLLDLDKAPAALLPIYGRWLGIDTGEELFDESILRNLVKQAYELCRIKGTKEAVKRVAEIILQSDVILLEHNVIMKYVTRKDEERFKGMFGDSNQDVTLLVKREMDSTLKSRLMYLLDQFKPIRTNIRTVVLFEDSVCDSHCYLDVNACLRGVRTGTLDSEHLLDDAIVLM